MEFRSRVASGLPFRLERSEYRRGARSLASESLALSCLFTAG